MVKTETQKINGNEYHVTQMDAIEAFKTQTYIVKTLAPLLQYLKGSDTLSDAYDKGVGAVNNALDEGSEDDQAIKVLTSILDKIDDDKFHSFFVRMCEQAFRGDERVQFNKHFAGNLFEAYKVFFFVLKVNFADFLKDVLGAANAKTNTSMKA